MIAEGVRVVVDGCHSGVVTAVQQQTVWSFGRARRFVFGVVELDAGGRTVRPVAELELELEGCDP